MNSTRHNDKNLGIYLNDHLAGATAGAELASRLVGETRNRAGGKMMTRLASEISEDRRTLVDVMASLDVPVRQYKTWLGWLGEKAARLKLNGHLLTRSPLSLVIGLEAMRLGVDGKTAVWRTLRARAATDSRLDPDQLNSLLERARRQSDQLERLRILAATEAFGGDADPLETMGVLGDGEGP